MGDCFKGIFERKFKNDLVRNYSFFWYLFCLGVFKSFVGCCLQDSEWGVEREGATSTPGSAHSKQLLLLLVLFKSLVVVTMLLFASIIWTEKINKTN